MIKFIKKAWAKVKDWSAFVLVAIVLTIVYVVAKIFLRRNDNDVIIESGRAEAVNDIEDDRTNTLNGNPFRVRKQ